MKVLYVTNDVYGQGGVARVLSVKTSYLVKKFKYQIDIISSSKKSKSFYEYDPSITITNLPFSRSLGFGFFSYVRQLKNEIKQSNPDCIVICDNGLKGHFFCFLNFNKPLVFESHSIDLIPLLKTKNPFIGIKKFFLKTLVDLSLTKVDKHVVLSKSMAFLFNSKNTDIIPNPLWFSPQEKTSYNFKKVIAVGRLTPIKGYVRMLCIWKKIHYIKPDWKLHIYGNGSQKNDLMNEISRLHLESCVKIKASTPFIDDVYPKYDFLIHTSLYDSFPSSLIEANGCGLPIIAFDCPMGPKEIILDKMNGFLIANNDEDAFIKKTAFLIENREQRILMSKNALASSLKYDLDTIMTKWNELFLHLKNNY